MSTKVKILIGLGLVFALIGVFGVYKFVVYQMRVYNTIVKHNAQFNTVNSFLNYSFPEELDKWGNSLKANQPVK